MPNHPAAPKPAPIPVPRRRRTRPLGPFSYLLMRTVNRLPKQLRYGAVLEQELSEKYGEMIDLAQVYVALQRLVDKGFITGQEAPTPTGYKHKVVVYSITPAGREALRHARSFYEMLAEPDPR